MSWDIHKEENSIEPPTFYLSFLGDSRVLQPILHHNRCKILEVPSLEEKHRPSITIVSQAATAEPSSLAKLD
jgi:hypothetical protein